MTNAEWPEGTGRVVTSEVTVKVSGDTVLRTVVEDAPFHRPGGTDLVFETWEDDGLVCSTTTVEAELCGSDSGEVVEDELLALELFDMDDPRGDQIEEYLEREWRRQTVDHSDSRGPGRAVIEQEGTVRIVEERRDRQQ